MINILIDGFRYNMREHFAHVARIFPHPFGARQNTPNSLNIHAYYMQNHRLRYVFSLAGIYIVNYAKIIGKYLD